MWSAFILQLGNVRLSVASSPRLSSRHGIGWGTDMAEKSLFDQLPPDDLCEVAWLLGMSEPDPGFICYMRMTPALPVPFSMADAVRAYMDCIRGMLYNGEERELRAV